MRTGAILAVVATASCLAAAGAAGSALAFRPYVAVSVGAPSGLAIGDLTGDGRADVALVTCCFANGRLLHVFRQDATGGLALSATYPVGGNQPMSLALGHLDGDGRLDVAVANGDALNGAIGVFRQNAAGTLDPMVTYPTPNGALVRIGDVNGDGLADVVSLGGVGTSTLSVFLQDGAGGLGPPTAYPVLHGGKSDLEIGDVNGDGRADVVVVSGQGFAFDNLALLYQTPTGSLAPAVYRDLGGDQLGEGLAIGDLNGDGRQDVAMTYTDLTGPTLHRLARFLQQPDGTLAAPQIFTTQFGPQAVVAADLDGDGRQDLVVAHNTSTAANVLGVFLQQPGGALAPEQLFPGPIPSSVESHGLDVGDLDGDGTLDIAGGLNSNFVVWHQADTVGPTVAIQSPAGEDLYVGVPHTIRWTAQDPSGLLRVDVAAATGAAQPFVPIAACTGLPGTATSCTWPAPGPAMADGRLRVTATDLNGNTGSATVTLRIVSPVLTLTHPTAAAEWGIGSRRRITWSGNLPATALMDVAISRDGGASWTAVATGVPYADPFAWTAAGPAAAACRMRVAWSAAPAVSDQSDADFAIAAPRILVTLPNGGERLVPGTTEVLQWTHNLGMLEAADVELSRDGGASWTGLAAAVPNTGDLTSSFSWVVSGRNTRQALVRVRWSPGGIVLDASDAPFAIRALLPGP